MDWETYYSNPKNIEKIAKFCRYREVVIIKRLPEKNMTLRPLKIFKPEHLQYWIKRLELTKIKFDLYISNASVRLPPLPSDLRELKEGRKVVNQLWADWMEGKNNFVTGFDIFADIDIDENHHRGKAREYAMILAGGLREKGYTPQIWDTSRGFHVIVMGKFQPQFAFSTVFEICKEKNILTSMSKICKKCGTVFYKDKCPKCGEEEFLPPSKPYVDLSVTADVRRIRRCPYSLHSKTGEPMLPASRKL